MSVSGARTRIEREVLTWPGVTAHPHRFGGVEYRLGRREIGHIHGDHLVDVPFPSKVRNEVITEGRAVPHHVLPESGWVTLYLRGEDDIEGAVDLLRRSFNLAVKQRKRRTSSKQGGT
jgi:hypothetical protein